MPHVPARVVVVAPARTQGRAALVEREPGGGLVVLVSTDVPATERPALVWRLVQRLAPAANDVTPGTYVTRSRVRLNQA